VLIVGERTSAKAGRCINGRLGNCWRMIFPSRSATVNWSGRSARRRAVWRGESDCGVALLWCDGDAGGAGAGRTARMRLLAVLRLRRRGRGARHRAERLCAGGGSRVDVDSVVRRAESCDRSRRTKLGRGGPGGQVRCETAAKNEIQIDKGKTYTFCTQHLMGASFRSLRRINPEVAEMSGLNRLRKNPVSIRFSERQSAGLKPTHFIGFIARLSRAIGHLRQGGVFPQAVKPTFN